MQIEVRLIIGPGDIFHSSAEQLQWACTQQSRM